MEGPTPVSALIHAATMVTAGVFLVIRCSLIFEISSVILFLIVFIGSITSFLMSVIGAFQVDIKKVVAYSTASQLGYMFMACGLSNYNVAFFHLFTHAFFKALLFLSMGVIIHALADEQDFRKMGSLINFLPLTSVMVFFGSYALLGLPFLAGFFSKDMLLEIALVRIYLDGYFSYFLGLTAAFFTSFYSTRLFIRIFFSYSNVIKNYMFNIHEADILMYIPLIVLLLSSFVTGYFFFDMFVGLGSYFFFDSIFINMQSYGGFLLEFDLNNINKLMPLFITLFGFFVYYLLDNRLYIYYQNKNYRNIYYIFYFGLFFDKFYVEKLLSLFYYFCYESYYKNIEVGFFQKNNIVILEKYFLKKFTFLKHFSSGFFYLYILVVIFFIFIFIYFFYSFILFNQQFKFVILIYLVLYIKTPILTLGLNNINLYFLKEIELRIKKK
jgi:NADH-ubiquinone oxidoreductase chain 5